jgi:isocitrate dehydrogenase
MKWVPEDGEGGFEHQAYNFKGAGCMMGMYNTEASITTFARTCFKFAL